MNTTDRIPLYQQIQDYIRTLIDSEGLKGGDRIPTEKELMDRFNVSKITVVNALSGLANEKIINRVPGRGSFVTIPETEQSIPVPLTSIRQEESEAAAVGTRASTGIIGLIMPSIDDYFAARLVKGIQSGLLENGYRAVILLSGGIVEMEKEAIKTLKNFGAEGILIFPVDEDQYNEEILSMKFGGYPFVLIDRYLPGVETHYIAADGKLGASLAVDHLWELGHRDIAICSDSPLQTVTVQDRIEGYMDALKNKGALINPAHIITDFLMVNMENMESHPLFRYIRNRMATAYITLNGRLGVQIYQMAQQAGFHIPDDVSIVSFDDPTSIVEEFSTFTHIKQFEYEMGYRAASKLLDNIKNHAGKDRIYDNQLIQPELVIRQTSGPCRK
ncbi:LacI family transcriptional regulator [Paenibacillus baekrokdamisoli]|uniref:LacI family transcriptional regulator n=1 Tax=Paenibacillus baekrokdamisoli TaxID=1712516 RepID=A0A3G9INI5_9BACL|nr:GntR family transcriptional regulator [Paenibacillus baekrokdamisoli]MBB3072107.1 GntR family transcriptional regulator of arabinose operon [Paenibacillus baekrokdamisoli]BBH20410.1 LacI family transcriptional regulator [Paenibacillus baekrokdamisoli]